MSYRFFICDVFTRQKFGGNPLAVLPDATGLTDGQMQQITREFHFSESAFVFPAGAERRRRVRIFTPAAEIPFAGHPSIGTAFALAQDGAFGPCHEPLEVTLEERAGLVIVTVRRDHDGSIWCELRAPQALIIGDEVDIAQAAAAISLSPADILTTRHRPIVASAGLPYILVELASPSALPYVRADLPTLVELREHGIIPDVLVYARSDDGFDIRSRMFSPMDGIPEDPATGSAHCALAALLEHLGIRAPSNRPWRIAQGIEMGRPSYLEARARRDGKEIRSWIGGSSVLVCTGELHVP